MWLTYTPRLLAFAMVLLFAFVCVGCGCGDDDDDDNIKADDDDDSDNSPCYDQTLSGCSSISWNNVKLAIEALYLFDNSYFGYNKEEALEVAKAYYDNGVYPESYIHIFGLEDLDEGKWRAYAIVTGDDGFPAEDLGLENFLIRMGDSEDLVEPTTLRTVQDAMAEDMDLTSSLVVDDSGSITDCDANFIAKGLTHLLETLPPFYDANLIKFGTDVLVAQDWTSDSQALINAMWSECAGGSTSLWDALVTSLNSVPETREGMRLSVVFTDGLDNTSDYDLNDVIDLSKEVKVPVFAIGLGLADIFALEKLGRKTHGGLIYVPTGEEIYDAFELMTTFLLEAYVIEWEAEGDFSKVKIYSDVSDGDEVSDTWEM